MEKIIFWLYIFNATLLLLHEMDSAYWKEWELFRLPGGITGFLAVHIPAVFLILWGVVQVYLGTSAGRILALLLGIAGLSAFIIHDYFIRQGRREFSTPVSRLILSSNLVISVALTAATLYAMSAGRVTP